MDKASVSRRAFTVGLALAALGAGRERKLFVQPLGSQIAEGDIAYVVRSLGAFYAAEVAALPVVALPRSAFYPPRGRFRAEKLLAFLDLHAPADALHVVGVTAVDISTTKPPYPDWGVLGLAGLGAMSCVVSSFRCKKRATDRAHATVRLGKTAVHEIGHTFGLEHCESAGCLMQDAKGSVATTDGERDLCDGCLARLGDFVRAERSIPW